MINDEYLLVTSPDFPLIVNENGSVSLILNGFRPGTPINCTVSATNLAATGPSTTNSATTDEERKNLEIIDLHYNHSIMYIMPMYMYTIYIIHVVH